MYIGEQIGAVSFNQQHIWTNLPMILADISFDMLWGPNFDTTEDSIIYIAKNNGFDSRLL